MKRAPLSAGLVALACAFACASQAGVAVRAQTPPPPPAPALSASPAAPPSGTSSALPAPAATASALPTATPTQPPIIVQPQAASVPVGSTQSLHVQSALGMLTVTPADNPTVGVAIDQGTQTVALTGKAPGAVVLTISDQRGVSVAVPVRVAYNAGTFADGTSIRITGDPASAQFVKAQAVAAAAALAQPRAGAQVVASVDEVDYSQALAQDDIAIVKVPMLIQGNNYFSVEGTTQVRVENVAAPKIMPDSLMVSDYPERLTENGILFTANLRRAQPSRFLYFHYNPPGQPDRRIVLRAQNLSPEPAILQYIDGAGTTSSNEMLTGHQATSEFLKNVVQNQGHIIVIPGNGTMNLREDSLPASAIASNMLQLRVLNGSDVKLTLFAQDASESPDASLADTGLLSGEHPHARGLYRIPEFHYSRLWNLSEDYLELPIGQIPLPNFMQGQALAGDYGVLESFVIKIQNPYGTPQNIAIYENPRGGRATGTYLIDGVLIQSHQVPAFSRYKIRQYVVPAHGFVRVTIATIPDSGSSYPLRLVFAPDDGSVPPGAPGSPVY